MLTYGDVCSGIGAATVAWAPLGWRSAFHAEIDKQPSAVLAHWWPDVPNLGDFTQIQGTEHGTIDLLVGGTPCQDFSIAGLRKGMAGARGNLSLEFLRLLERSGARWVAWENVTGVLSQDERRAFGAILGGLAELGYGWAYRVLDAQYVRVDGHRGAVPQRRRRVFVVGYLGDWRRAAAVLFERAGLLGDSPPRRQAGEIVAGPLGGSSQSGGFRTTDLDNQGAFIPEAVPQAMSSKWAKGSSGPAGDEIANLIAFDCKVSGKTAHSIGEVPGSLRGQGHGGGHAAVAMNVSRETAWRVRRLTPLECERLQGFPDGHTAVPYSKKAMADGPRYKMLGNAMPVNVMRWIGRRIEMVEALP